MSVYTKAGEKPLLLLLIFASLYRVHLKPGTKRTLSPTSYLLPKVMLTPGEASGC